VTAEFANLNFLSANLKVTGPGVAIALAQSHAAPNARTAKFVPMPQGPHSRAALRRPAPLQ
jgi:hypothetical protein